MTWRPRTVEDRWLVEIVLDTGQRYQSDAMPHSAAVDVARDMRCRLRVVAVTMLHLETGECVQRPSRNLAAGVPLVAMDYRRERELLAEALGGP